MHMGNTVTRTHVFGITYGRAKVGKTVAMVRAFPDALFIAPPGALLCSKWLDWEPKVLEVRGNQGFKYITDALKRAAGNFPAIVIDDFSLIGDAELANCRQSAPGFAAFDLFAKRVYELKEAARAAGAHVFLTCHEQAPREVKKDNNNRYIPGAPMIAGWQMPEKLPAMVDFCARVIHDDSGPGWPFLYATGPDQNYIQGDRLAILPNQFPLNLREAMLGADIDVPRPEPLAWMEEHVEAIALELLEDSQAKKPNFKPVLLRASMKLSDHSPRHVRWVLADALDRMVLRQHTSNLLTDFIGSY